MCSTNELHDAPDHTGLDLGTVHSRESLSLQKGLTQDCCFSLREDDEKQGGKSVHS